MEDFDRLKAQKDAIVAREKSRERKKIIEELSWECPFCGNAMKGADVFPNEACCGESGRAIKVGVVPHDWECLSPGMYDFLYRCKKCKKTHTEQVDNTQTERPEFGCVA